jgi:hypothetical protein
VGEYVPMPPVFRPASPSSARLWSCDVGNSFAVLPSQIAWSEISMPSRNSWMTMFAPAAPKALLTRISSIALFASATPVQIKTPLPSARPSAFTAHLPSSDAANFWPALPPKTPGARRRDAVFLHELLGENFRRLELRGFWFGPQMRRPFFWNKSTMPSASGLSGPTTVSSIFFSCANASSFGKSSAPRFTHSTGAEFLASRSCAMPALPGAHHSTAWMRFTTIYPPLSIGLGVLLVVMEGLWLKTGKPVYHQMARFWTKVFALTFAIGVATGIVMEFEFGTNWATYSRYVGDVFGSALAAEGIFAFFLESGFLAVLLFGWDRVSRKLHFFSTCMVCLGAHFSAIWIVVANSWMQTPAGYHIVGEG